MVEQLDFLKCYYRPAFFQIKIDLPVDLGNLQEATDATLSLYLHEYIHFIQDLSTIYGLMNISTINYYLQDCAARISKQEEKGFEVPQKLVKRDDFGYLNFNLSPIYLGSDINPKYKKITYLSYQKEQKKVDNNDIDTIIIYFRDEISGVEKKIYLGGKIITEGMAYLAERYIYEKILAEQNINIPVDEYPYCLVEKIANSIYPEIAEDIILIAICDCCLMTYHPGLSFIRAITFLKQQNFIENNADNPDFIEELYSILEAYLKGSHVSFEVILEDVRASIKKSFKADILEENNQWIDIIFNRIKSARTTRPPFIVDFLQFGELKNNQFFSIVHKSLGSPLVLNSENIATITLPTGFTPTSFHPYLFWAINQTLRIFSKPTTSPCEMKDFCKKSNKISDPNIIVDKRCDTEPWTRYNDRNLCPMGIMWKHWGLSGYFPIYK
ncbi:hypothetical protein [Chryseobacterium sp. MEBOG07]|uniref:hypothetical protein n=1 Tax=Chryseobacterium sp. MEBOG07 TaxID=2879939 RepID=UPI001F23B29E|nr:hypothetical protein [Chryseobacterium sp. MEBOG07]UKB79557.1 hypothetical protein LF886_00690 [Chryseobacterium sp. MEBOG07]